MFHMLLTAYPLVVFSSGRGIQARIVPNSLDPADYLRLPLYKLKGAKGSTAFFNAVVWLVFDSISTWRSMSQLYCNVADMEDLADSVYDAIPAALGSVCPALPAVPKISKNLVAYIAGMLVTAVRHRSLRYSCRTPCRGTRRRRSQVPESCVRHGFHCVSQA